MAKRKPSAKGKSSFEKFVSRRPKLTVLTDQPLPADQARAGFELDPFNFRYKLGPVYDIIRYKAPDDKKDSDRETPLAILISGGWGTGKTSAMKWLEGLLADWNRTAGPDDIKVYPVWFYPWKYGSKEDVWRGLISEVIIESIKVEDVTWQRAKNAAKQFGLFLGKSFLHALASVKFKGKLSAGVAETEAEADLTCLKDILGEYQDAAHPEKAYLNEFEDSLEKWVTGTLRDNERILLLIDDLDRCMPDIALQVLEALKLYLNIPKLIFVVGVDRSVVEKLVVEHYTKLGLVRRRAEKDTDADHEQRRADEAKARQYLAKMFQVEVELAPSQQQVQSFFADQLNGIPYWKDNVERAHQSLFRNVVLELAGRNPREVKRLLNSGLMAGAGTKMMLASKGATPPTFEQGLQDYFVRTILQRRYPSLADMTATDVGRQFFADWSTLVADQQRESKDVTAEPPSKDRGQRAIFTHTKRGSGVDVRALLSEEEPQHSDRIVEELRRKPEYAEYLRLTTDPLLASLMQIPFSAELAQRTRQATIPPIPTVSATQAVEVPAVAVGLTMAPRAPQPPPTKDQTIILEAIARAVNKSPWELTEADCQQVTSLDLSLSQVSDLADLKDLTNLRVLFLTGTQVRDLTALKNLTNLQKLLLDATQVKDVTALKDLTNLQRLWLDGTQVSDVMPIAALTNLHWLSLYGARVSDVTPLVALTNLHTLHLGGTEVSDVTALKKLTNLQTLSLDGTRVSDVMPLKDLTDLQTLWLSGTWVSDVTALKELTNLQTLLLDGTPVSDVTALKGLTNLRWLSLDATQVSDDQVKELEKALPKLKIQR